MSIQYDIDPHNKLVFTKSSRRKGLPKFRKVLEGRFKTDKNNTLTYHIKRSSAPDLPQQIKLDGKWSLDRDYNLRLSLNKWQKNPGGSITLKGDITDVKANSIFFAVTVKNHPSKSTVYILELKGSWRTDKYNRLIFHVNKKNGETDHLLFKGTWDINKNNSIVYTYKKSHLKTKKNMLNMLTFKGYWDITEKQRLLYVLNKRINSFFDFRISTGKPTTRGMLYEIGIGVNPELKKIKISGKWKLNKKLGILFEVRYDKGETKNIIFGASCKLGKTSSLELRLTNPSGKNMGMNLKLSKTFFDKQGRAYFRALTSGREKQILIGAGMLW
jgi:hypothetical protein